MPKAKPIPTKRQYTLDELKRLRAQAEHVKDFDTVVKFDAIIAEQSGIIESGAPAAEETRMQRFSRLRDQASLAGDTDTANRLSLKISELAAEAGDAEPIEDIDAEPAEDVDAEPAEETDQTADGDEEEGDDEPDDQPINNGLASKSAQAMIDAASLAIEDIPGSGKDGQVTKPDVEKYAAALKAE